MSDETFLVTGAFGCIGAWILRNLTNEGTNVVAMDLATDPVRPRLLLSPAELERITFLQTDITDLANVKQAVEQYEISHIIHLAGLQIPFCKARPSLGARVNVVGTVNIFEAVRQYQEQIRGVAYASSIAVLGPAHLYPQHPVPDEARPHPETLYGVYKQANEETARIYWQDWQIGSVGLRPYVVYGVGRDQGLTSDVTKAVLAAAAGQPYQIGFDGQVALQYADDVARIFIGAARANYQGATVCNLRNDVVDVADFVKLLRQKMPGVKISHVHHHPLPFPADLDDSNLKQVLGTIPHTPLPSAISQTLDRFGALLAQKQIDLGQLEQV